MLINSKTKVRQNVDLKLMNVLTPTSLVKMTLLHRCQANNKEQLKLDGCIT